MYLELDKITKKFDQSTVVKELSISIGKGEILCLLGPSGCGKTTTLKMIGGFLKPDSGRIRIEGQDITNLPPESRPVSTVFQSYALFPHLSVLENVMYGLKFMGLNKKEAARKSEEYLEMVSLLEYRNSKIHELSGGQQQRVALVRAMVVSPKVLLLDEPLSNLDAELRVKMREEIRNLQKKFDMTMVFVTHDQEEAMVLGDKVAIMHEGCLMQYGSAEHVYNNPDNLFTMNFLGSTNKLTDKDGRSFYARPEHIVIDKNGDLDGVVVEKTFLGFYSRYKILCQDQLLQVNVHWGQADVNKNQQIRMKLLNKIYL